MPHFRIPFINSYFSWVHSNILSVIKHIIIRLTNSASSFHDQTNITSLNCISGKFPDSAWHVHGIYSNAVLRIIYFVVANFDTTTPNIDCSFPTIKRVIINSVSVTDFLYSDGNAASMEDVTTNVIIPAEFSTNTYSGFCYVEPLNSYIFSYVIFNLVKSTKIIWQIFLEPIDLRISIS
ncbi:hypothetical protein MSSAC_1029 [Methanosarcina siciliae C2J]|uniref:Uncharacterized protein n=1 Tax=Methanosarcina siciliae C2J TaxID=1434118 RepID=A0A0E3PLF2_9EURY|nr:hypothetical protein MSSAC_1029 [Methanosarcina siciliae C2J]